MPDEGPPRPQDEAARHEAEALRRSEERFRALVEHSADVIVLVGSDARFTYASASTLRVLGRPPSDLVGRHAFELMHPDDLERCRRLFQNALEHPGVTVRAEFRYLHQDGSWRHMEADGVNRLDDPAVGGISANFRDVTERKKAEEARRRSEERQALLYAVLAAAGAELDADHARAAAVRVMSERTGCRNIHLSVPAEDGRHWKVRACSEEGLVGSRLPIGPGIVGRAFLTGRTQLVPDVSLDPDYVGVVPDIRSEVAVPIRHQGRTLGVLNLESERLDAFSVEDARLAESVADAVALALENASLYRAAADERERLGSLIAATDNGILLVGGAGAVQVINEPRPASGSRLPRRALAGTAGGQRPPSPESAEASGLIA
jgi:PAS domain S-box-containing protein